MTARKGKARSPVTELLLSILRIVMGVYVGLCLLVLLRQSSYVYYPDKTVGLTPGYLGMEHEDVVLETEDGESIAAWFISAGKEGAGADTNANIRTILVCHGNAGDIGDRIDSIKTFHDLGMNVFIFDYRGYGDSSGRPTEQGTYLDGMAAWNHLVEEKGVAAGDIVLFGRSLGAAVAAWLAVEVEPAALVTESAFTSAPDMAASMFPFLPVKWLCRFKYNTLERIGRAGCPVLVVHSREDEMIPFKHALRLFEAASEPKKLLETLGGHNYGGMEADRRYVDVFVDFLDKHLGDRPLQKR